MATGRKIVIATFGSLGDLNPFVALAHALKRQGSEPVVATSEFYRSWIESEGLGFAPMRPDVDELTERLGMDIGEIARRVTQDDGFMFRELIFPYLRRGYDDVVAASDGAAAIVAHSIAFAAQIAAERLRLPLVNVVLSPLFLMSAHDPPQGEGSPFVRGPRSAPALAYNKAMAWSLTQILGQRAAPIGSLRRELGLPRRRGRALLTGGPSAAATIALASPLLAPPQPDHPRNTFIAGHTFHDRFIDAAAGLPPELDAFLGAGSPPLVVTLGSFVVRDKIDFYCAAGLAARRIGRRAVLLAADEECSALSEGLPADIFVAGYVPHSRLFPRACAIAHHGGSGTSGQALRAGKPQLVIPFLGDQPDNAGRLARLGVARRLPYRRFAVDSAAAELEALFAEESYARRAGELGAIVAREDGAARAAEKIADILERELIDAGA